MIVVADASPLNYLIQIQAEELLQRLFGQVLVPHAVMQELRHPRAPEAVAVWISRIPSWIEVRAVATPEDLLLQALDPGEREASCSPNPHTRTSFSLTNGKAVLRRDGAVSLRREH